MPVTPYGRDLCLAPTPVALGLFPTVAGQRQHDCPRFFKTDVKLEGQARIAERAGEPLFEELANVGGDIWSSGGCHQ